MTGNLRVNPGVILTIEPGTRIQVDPGRSIVVQGELVAQGTAADRIVISGSPDLWGGVYFESGSVGTIEFCDISGPTGSIGLFLADHVTISKNVLHGLGDIGVIRNESGTLISQNLFVGNTGAAISDSWGGASILHNTIVGNR